MTARKVACLEISQGSRILAMHGILDAFGHVSRRSPERDDRFLISRNLAPALVKPQDVLELDLDGVPTDPSGASLFLERYIHSEIYRARPDVMAVVHSHATAVLPFTVVRGLELRPVCHMCGFLDGIGAPFDVSKAAGQASDLLISNPELGCQFTQHLGGRSIGLIRGHGFTALGRSIPEAIFRTVYTVRNCEVTLMARSHGDLEYLSKEEAAKCDITVGSQANRAWALWLHMLANAGGIDAR